MIHFIFATKSAILGAYESIDWPKEMRVQAPVAAQELTCGDLTSTTERFNSLNHSMYICKTDTSSWKDFFFNSKDSACENLLKVAIPTAWLANLYFFPKTTISMTFGAFAAWVYRVRSITPELEEQVNHGNRVLQILKNMGCQNAFKYHRIAPISLLGESRIVNISSYYNIQKFSSLSLSLYDRIKNFSEKNLVVIVAAGNDGAPIDPHLVGLAKQHRNIIVVGGFDNVDIQTPMPSNYAQNDAFGNELDFCFVRAPFFHIIDGRQRQGTSFGAPMVSAVIARLIEMYPDHEASDYTVLVSQVCINNASGFTGFGKCLAWPLVEAEANKRWGI